MEKDDLLRVFEFSRKRSSRDCSRFSKKGGKHASKQARTSKLKGEMASWLQERRLPRATRCDDRGVLIAIRSNLRYCIGNVVIASFS